MCGIAGYLTRNSQSLQSAEIIGAMIETINHRGPDAEGVWIDREEGLAFGHKRLSILDVTNAGSQPMVSMSRRWVIIFNGEIYNHKSLRSDLEKICQRSWRGHSDTETLLACIDEWGIEKTIKKCIGMFAIALWCRISKKLYLIRDRFGEKPLYYSWQGWGDQGAFIFGSELKALRRHPAFRSAVCHESLSLYLKNLAVPGHGSIYRDVYKVAPGTILEFGLGYQDPIVSTYWSAQDVVVQSVQEPFIGSESYAIDALENLLKDAVTQQMVTDVPIGAFLSGGVDSSTIVALMQSQSASPVKTFSIGFHEDKYNEAEYAREVAGHIGTDHTELYVTPKQALDVIPLLPSLYDEPFADSSQIPTFLVSQMTRRHVTVALSGDAGDELFGGYNRYSIASGLWPRLSRIPSPFRHALSYGITRFSPNTLDHLLSYFPFAKKWAGIGDKLHKGAAVMGANTIDSLYMGLVATGWANPDEILIGFVPPRRGLLFPELPGLSDVERMMALDCLNYLPDDILSKVDRASMGVGLESRVPFLDHRVFEFAWRLPMDYKLRSSRDGLITKWILRQILYRYVPRKLIERPKVGFGVPLGEWLRGPLREWAEDMISPDRLKRDGYFKTDPVRARWAEHLSGKRNHQHSLWCVLMFQAWLDTQGASAGRIA
jgi:asparagine synthase (glutamine-hydrolysing)